jgi:hypothetical protein
MEWKWTKGEPYERSRRLKQVVEIENQQFSKEVEKDAYTSALNHDENTWDILNQTLSGTGFKVSNKREELDTKIADRHLVQQRGFNPFLGDNDYVNDVTVRDQFLKPMNTTSDRVSTTNEK